MIKKIIVCVAMFSLLLTGCGDLVEIQGRDFVLALGISYTDGQYQVTYSLPDLAKVTEQSKESESNGLIRTYEGHSLPELEQVYNLNSENRLDYRHLQAIILDDSICTNQTAMQKLLVDLNDNYDISNNVLVYYYDGAVEEIIELGGGSGSVGEHLKKLSHNNEKNEMEPAKIGTLIDCLANERTLFIPALIVRDDSIAIDGGIFFFENHLVKRIDQADCVFYFISLGQGSDTLVRLSPDHLIRLKDVKAKTTYALTEEGPAVHLTVTGAANPLPQLTSEGAYPAELMNQYIEKEISRFLDENLKTQQLDCLNFYEKSSYKNRQMWLAYEGKHEAFMDDLSVNVSVEIEYR